MHTQTGTTITPTDTYDTFIGSGALGEYSWWDVINVVGAPEGLHTPAAPDWRVIVDEWDDGAGTGAQFVFDHKSIMVIVNQLAATDDDARPEFMNVAVLEQCRTFVRDTDEADFDADAADQVMQYLAFGKVIYG